jgi:pyruvate dehydrogenase (quinone)
MGPRVADLVIDRLGARGVKRICGYPWDGINGLTTKLRRAGGCFAIEEVRCAETATLMACAHATFGGVLGVCLVTPGPGDIHAPTGLDALTE